MPRKSRRCRRNNNTTPAQNRQKKALAEQGIVESREEIFKRHGVWMSDKSEQRVKDFRKKYPSGVQPLEATRAKKTTQKRAVKRRAVNGDTPVTFDTPLNGGRVYGPIQEERTASNDLQIGMSDEFEIEI